MFVTGSMSFRCIRKDFVNSFLPFMDTVITNCSPPPSPLIQSGEERNVVHMQYVDWPDHGEYMCMYSEYVPQWVLNTRGVILHQYTRQQMVRQQIGCQNNYMLWAVNCFLCTSCSSLVYGYSSSLYGSKASEPWLWLHCLHTEASHQSNCGPP